MSQELTPLFGEKIDRLDGVLLSMPQANIETIHTFLPGIYERKIIVPPWTVLTGAEHRTPYRIRVEAGRIAVNTDLGIVILEAPAELNAPAGVRRVGRVFEEWVHWVDIYDNPDDCRDIQALEDRLYVVPDIGLGSTRRQALIDRDRDDYQKFLEENSLNEQMMTAVESITHDIVLMPDGYAVEFRESPINGIGMFAAREFCSFERICPGRINGHRTPAGRFINHSKEPNAKPEKSGDDIWAVALRPIHLNEEITIDYRESMRVNPLALGE